VDHSPHSSPLVSIITATTGHPHLSDALNSVSQQTFREIEHLIFIDGESRLDAAKAILHSVPEDTRRQVVTLPFSVGENGFNGHRMYGAGTYLARGKWLCFLDEDNFFQPDHIERLLVAVRHAEASWAYSLRMIVDQSGQVLCPDNCESLGFWPSCLNDKDHLIDVNCYFLRRDVALAISPLWYRRARQAGVMEVDRVICRALLKSFGDKGVLSGHHSVGYRVEATPKAVRREFFFNGNRRLAARYGAILPWLQRDQMTMAQSGCEG
jgi:glycosyltransferase involved in cell wall biosynthesis